MSITKQIHHEFVDKNKYLTILKKHTPNLREEKIVWYIDGWDFILAVIDSQAFRFPRRKDYESKLPTEAAFIKEFISKSPIAIPELKLHSDTSIGNYASYLFLPGVPFTKKLAETFSTDNKMFIARQIGKFLTSLHSFPIAEARKIGITEIDALSAWSDRFEKIKSKVFPYLDKKEQDWTIKIFTAFLKLVKDNPVENKVTHSDIMPEHVIVDPQNQTLTGIIDFGDIEISDPAYDFTFLKKYGKEFLDEAYRNYAFKRDPVFEKRRQFYEDILVVTNLEHSIKVGDQYWIKKHQEELTKYFR